MVRFVAVTIVVWAALLIGAGAASAASFTVDSTGDAPDASAADMSCATAAGECTLRAALQQSQAVGGSNAIDFDLPDPSTIDLASALPFIGPPVAALDISGPGMQSLTVRRDSGGDYPVIGMSVDAASISGMTITNGRAQLGGGIVSSAGVLVLDDVAVVRNAAVAAGGLVAAGGGVEKTSGVLRIRRSTISENSATANGTSIGLALGGGISLTAVILEIIESTIDNNSATHVSSGNANAFGGGIGLRSVIARVVNSTVSGNSVTASGPGAITAAGGGISAAEDNGSLGVTGSTIAFNAAPTGANLYTDETPVSLRDTILSDPVGGANCSSVTSIIGSSGFNLASDTSCGLTGLGDQQPANPLLGPLAFNGGPTRTHALGLGSPAVDMGSAAASGMHPALTTDQRGEPRPADQPSVANAADGADIGAFELEVVNQPPVAVDDAYAVTGGGVLTVPAPGVLGNDSDPDGDTLTAQLVAGPATGTLTLNPDGSFTYVPSEDAVSGPVTFTYQAFDGEDLSNVASVTITVTAGCDGVAATITGTAGNNTLNGTSGDDVIVGRGGNDRIDPGSGNDRVCGGSGADTVELSSGNDRIFGGSGNDTLAGGSGDDSVWGGEGNDLLDGGSDRDRLFGEAGVDRLFGGGDPDALDGGPDTPDRCDGEGGSDTATACEQLTSIP